MNLSSWKQFGRYVEVNIHNFENQTETIFGNDFEIDFEFYKSIDKTQEDDVGKIKIYGLSERTISSLQDSGGEVTLTCGYGNRHLPLFQAYIVRIYSQIENNTTVTTIDCSANFLNYYHIGSTGNSNYVQGSGKSLHLLLSEILLESGGVTDLKFTTETKLDTTTLKSLIEYTQTVRTDVSFIGTSTELLTEVLATYGLKIADDKHDEQGRLTEVVLMFSDFGIEMAKKNIAQGYPKATITLKKNSFRKPNEKEAALYAEFMEMYEEKAEDKGYVLLNEETGLLSLTPEYKTAKVSAATPLNSNEVETLKSQQSRLDKALKEKERDEKRAEKIRKALEAGKKPPKYKDGDNQKVETLTVIRKYARVKALLNPLVRPQSQVALYDKIASEKDRETSKFEFTDKSLSDENVGDIYMIHRVRHVTYKGNNKRGDWIMDLYCEDTENNLTDEQLREELSKSPETLQEDTEELGEDDFG